MSGVVPSAVLVDDLDAFFADTAKAEQSAGDGTPTQDSSGTTAVSPDGDHDAAKESPSSIFRTISLIAEVCSGRLTLITDAQTTSLVRL